MTGLATGALVIGIGLLVALVARVLEALVVKHDKPTDTKRPNNREVRDGKW